MIIKLCPKCSKEFNNDSGLCSKCGFSMQDSIDLSVPIICPNCEMTCSPGTSICDCGYSFENYTIDSSKRVKILFRLKSKKYRN